jgi:hypothetical protein
VPFRIDATGTNLVYGLEVVVKMERIAKRKKASHTAESQQSPCGVEMYLLCVQVALNGEATPTVSKGLLP